MKHIDVVAGIIWNATNDKILVSKRPDHLHKGGYWEFPGGKIEAGESKECALARELAEELSIHFSASEHFQSLVYEYPEKIVSLSFFHVRELVSEAAVANEGQEWKWVSLDVLAQLRFPEANQPVVDALVGG